MNLVIASGAKQSIYRPLWQVTDSPMDCRVA